MAVYFVQAGENGPIKIGRAVNPRARIAILQSAHYQTLTILRIIDEGDATTETWLHRQFRSSRIRGEWFHHDPSMLSIEPVLAPPQQRRPIRPIRSDNPVSDIIARCGGADGVANAAGTTAWAVKKWPKNGIPEWHWEAVRSLCQISVDELFDANERLRTEAT